MPHPDQRTIKLTIECLDLPPHNWGGHPEIWLGIQRGKEVEQEVKLPAERIVFEAELRVAGDPSHGASNFLGPYAQGTVQDRFTYLCWGWRHFGMWVGFRRIKLPLSGLTWDEVATGSVVAHLRCTDAKGGPICATVRGEYLTWSSPKD